MNTKPAFPTVTITVFTVTLFASASLLFLIEPMVGKMMLPLLGGTPAVWNTCMVFFQAVLLAGYAYAHVTTTWLGPRRQAALHLVVLALPFLFFLINGPLAIPEGLIAGQESNPIPALLLVLTLSVGMPMFVVCTSAPVLQRWFSSTDHPSAGDPYFLYGASNLGSMLALAAYPFLVERFFPLSWQRLDWAVGYAVLAGLTAFCAVLLWRSQHAPTLALAGTPAEVPAPVNEKSTEPVPSLATQTADSPVTAARKRGKKRGQPRDDARPPQEPAAAQVKEPAVEVSRPVTWLRRLHWVALAAVPSSLMLGVTTYITTDIAAIPLLWAVPLALYLLSFIIVFAHIRTRTQNVLVFVAALLGLLAVAVWALPLFASSPEWVGVLWLLRLGCLVPAWFSARILDLRDGKLLHRVMVMVMPLVLLLLIFMMLADIKPERIQSTIGIHCLALFVVSMVCHGELANDRPAPSHLTEYFLWMSFGGVVGGIFNGLVAPLVFNALVEYPLIMVGACLLVPPLSSEAEDTVSRRSDLALGVGFLVVGGILTALFFLDRERARVELDSAPWAWGAAALLGALVLAGLRFRFVQPAENWQDRLLDLVLPLALLGLVFALCWGLRAKHVADRVADLAERFNIHRARLGSILEFGVPAVLCYTFVERQLRFGLGVGALLLAGGFSDTVSSHPLFRDRSFFGVLEVERRTLENSPYQYPAHRLMHGTTLHGQQFRDEALREVPLTYYHKTGPVGQVFLAYNTEPSKPVAVVGLGTGTMACYALPGQRMTFYDIDPVVKRISFDTDEYFSYITDARRRGADLQLILGDARLTMARQELAEHERYALMVIDAFSSDAIPVHLITDEALEKVYLKQLRPDGILCFHISNRWLRLHPVLANLADRHHLAGLHMSDDSEGEVGKSRSHWVCLARKPEHLVKLLHPPQWERNSAQLSLLGIMAYPRSGVGFPQAFASCLLEVSRATTNRKIAEGLLDESDWEPLETVEELTRKEANLAALLEKSEGDLQETEAKAAAILGAKGEDPEYEKKRKEAREKIQKWRERLKSIQATRLMTERVGVWTDDYSNVLSVFNW